MQRPFALILTLALLLAAAPHAAAAPDLPGHRTPAKPAGIATPPPPDPAVIRQGGDTLADAIAIPLMYSTTGTTAGYTDDHDEACPWSSTSPDVVYTFGNGVETTVSIDMYYSSYDTKIYVYDEDLNLVACNDDYWPDYTSYIGSMPVLAGVQYYLVIDGYGGDAGAYQMSIVDLGALHGVECTPDSELEGEPPLADGYVDAHNGGCNSLGDIGHAPFQHLGSVWFCGQSGWYGCEPSACRDTDWFTVTVPPSGLLEITGAADESTEMYELGPQDCAAVGVLQAASIPAAGEATLSIAGEPGSTVWIWVGPSTYAPPGGDTPQEYTYLLHLPQAVAVQARTLSQVKSLYH